MGIMTLRRILIMPCEMFYSIHLKSVRVVSLVGISRGIVGGHGYVI